jgi:hypothetical protein
VCLGATERQLGSATNSARSRLYTYKSATHSPRPCVVSSVQEVLVRPWWPAQGAGELGERGEGWQQEQPGGPVLIRFCWRGQQAQGGRNGGRVAASRRRRSRWSACTVQWHVGDGGWSGHWQGGQQQLVAGPRRSWASGPRCDPGGIAGRHSSPRRTLNPPVAQYSDWRPEPMNVQCSAGGCACPALPENASGRHRAAQRHHPINAFNPNISLDVGIKPAQTTRRRSSATLSTELRAHWQHGTRAGWFTSWTPLAGRRAT